MDMKDLKFPEDFKGWIPLYPIKGNHYLVIQSPDGTKEACIHLKDNDVVGVIDALTGETLYEDPLLVHMLERE